MPLTDTEICKALNSGAWKAYRDGKPIGAADLRIGPNSVDVGLGAELLEVKCASGFDAIDPLNPDTMTVQRWIMEEGSPFLICPGNLYLASVRESFDCSAPLRVDLGVVDLLHKDGKLLRRDDECDWVGVRTRTYFYPVIDGRSTLARVGLSVHQTAGRGDYGFDGQFTLELACLLPIVLYPGMRIGQVYFEPMTGVPTQRYNSVYQGQTGHGLRCWGRGGFDE